MALAHKTFGFKKRRKRKIKEDKTQRCLNINLTSDKTFRVLDLTQ